MSAQERRFYTTRQVTDLSRVWERRERDLSVAIRRELLEDIPALEQHAQAALRCETERFQGERSIARTVLERDIPRRRSWLRTAYDLLNFGNLTLRFEFCFPKTPEARDGLIQRVMETGGFSDEHGRFIEAWRDEVSR